MSIRNGNTKITTATGPVGHYVETIDGQWDGHHVPVSAALPGWHGLARVDAATPIMAAIMGRRVVLKRTRKGGEWVVRA